MRQAALTALRPLRRPQTPTIDFGSLPTFDVTSATPPNYSSGPSNTAPLLQSNSKSTSRMQVSPLPIRSPAYENPFANPPPQSAPAIPQQLDYFNCKPVPVPSTQVEQHPYRCKVSSPLSHSPYPAPPPCEGYPPSHVRSYWSPAITPAPLQSLTRPSSPSLDDAYDSPLSLFPYIAYESSSPILPLPTPPLSLTPTAALLDIKIYFSATHDLVKIRLPRSASLDELKSKAADRVSGAGWKALHVAKPGVDTRDPSDVAERDLDELDDEWRWRSWLTSAVKAERGSGLGKQRRIVIWAM
ncbi:hypothetical protein FRB90_007320 [Tulasnella sp. 427]|nr:hypothetical protein FRB90_007320 [Tulasnella sp. 427]